MGVAPGTQGWPESALGDLVPPHPDKGKSPWVLMVSQLLCTIETSITAPLSFRGNGPDFVLFCGSQPSTLGTANLFYIV